MYITPTILSNGLKYHGVNVATRYDYIYCSLTVRSGSLCDNAPGTAHFLEHVLLAFVKIYGYNKSKVLPVSGKTSFDRTCYYFACTPELIAEAVGAIKAVIFGRYLHEKYFEQVRRDILAEYSSCYKALEKEQAFLSKTAKDISSFIPIGTQNSIELLKFDDIRDFFNSEYSMDNMLLSIVGNVDIGLIDELFSTRIDDFLSEFNQEHSVATEFENANEDEYVEIFIPIDNAPFLHLNELHDNISVVVITEISKTFSSSGIIYVGIREYSKQHRFVNIRISDSASVNDYLRYIRRSLIQFTIDEIDVRRIQKGIEKNILSQMSEAETLNRIEDFFVYDAFFYPISVLIKQIKSVDCKIICYVVNNLLNASPVLVECKQNIVVRDIVGWSIA